MPPAAATSFISRAMPRPASMPAPSSKGGCDANNLTNFRRELAEGGGLSSYPHPWLMPEFLAVSDGFDGPGADHGDLPGPLQPLPAASRPQGHLANQKVWCFVGDGETDEPESLGALTLAAREKLDNLIFVVNCNLQRLDGPVRGNGKIIQELEAAFRGAGWNCHQGHLGQRLGCPAQPGQGRSAGQAHGARSSTAIS